MYVELEVCGGVPPLLRGSTPIFNFLRWEVYRVGEVRDRQNSAFKPDIRSRMRISPPAKISIHVLAMYLQTAKKADIKEFMGGLLTHQNSY